MNRLTAAGAVFETHHRNDSTLRYHRHGMSFATIVLDGSYTEVRDTVPHACAPGTIVVHSACEEHADHFLDDARCLNVELPHVEGAYGTFSVDAAVRTAVDCLVTAFYEDAELDATVVALQAALRDRVDESASRKPAWLDPVLDGFSWCDAVPLRDAAKMAGVHPVQFSRAFHKHVGMTPNDYRRESRLKRASDLLLVSTASLIRISQDCGFADQSHLTRTFSEALGVSPAHYRRVFAR